MSDKKSLAELNDGIGLSGFATVPESSEEHESNIEKHNIVK